MFGATSRMDQQGPEAPGLLEMVLDEGLHCIGRADEEIAGVHQIIEGDVGQGAARGNALDLMVRRVDALPIDGRLIGFAHVVAGFPVGLRHIDHAGGADVPAGGGVAMGGLPRHQRGAKFFQTRRGDEIAVQHHQVQLGRQLHRRQGGDAGDGDGGMGGLHGRALQHHLLAGPVGAIVIDGGVGAPELQDDLDRGLDHAAGVCGVTPAPLHLPSMKVMADAQHVAARRQLIGGVGLKGDLDGMIIAQGPHPPSPGEWSS